MSHDSPFSAGTFSPDPRTAALGVMVKAQSLIEAKLFLRHGEQLLLSFIIPIGMLIALAFAPFTWHTDPLQLGFPVMLATAAMSSGFTGQAISLAFDRRYNALKRVGASGVPAPTIILGKIFGLLLVAIVQILALVSVAALLGWRTDVPNLLLGIGMFFLGVAAFTAFGMLLGGTLSSEIVLGIANLIWVILVGLAGYSVVATEIPGVLSLIPSIALAGGIADAFIGVIPWVEILILSLWCVVGGVGAAKWFKFAD